MRWRRRREETELEEEEEEEGGRGREMRESRAGMEGSRGSEGRGWSTSPPRNLVEDGRSDGDEEQPRKKGRLKQKTYKLGMANMPPPSPSEPFLWMGWNYLLKMCHDLPFAPLPMASDPMVLHWFRYPSRDGLTSPPLRGWEEEWWFDAERLHSRTDLTRMRQAEVEILQEARRYPEARRPPSLEERLGGGRGESSREMEVLLYGKRLAAKMIQKRREAKVSLP